ncbi:MAG: hypothetical protein LIQ30_08825, partial [Planctomycetes bacterium]|nr:hypothetical protein [Planctomycetota bacterium]
MSELPVDPVVEDDNLPDAREFAAITEADAEAAEHPSFRALPWRSYVRCSFLLAIFIAVGYTAWRPAMIRFSVMMSAVSPSRGDSLAWQVLPEPVPPPSPRKRLPTPLEWRLAADHRSNWQAARSSINDVFSYQGGPLPVRSWSRDSTNPWAWEDDSEFGRKRTFDPEFQPNQKPATSFRVDETAGWGTAATADPSRDSSQNDAPAVSGRTVPSLAPLPGVAQAGTPPVTASAAEQAVQDVFSALQIPSLAPWTAGDLANHPPTATASATTGGSGAAGSTSAASSPSGSVAGAPGPSAPTRPAGEDASVSAGANGLSGDSGAALFGVNGSQTGSRTAPLVTPPHSLQRTEGESDLVGGGSDGAGSGSLASGMVSTPPSLLIPPEQSTQSNTVASDNVSGMLRPSGAASAGIEASASVAVSDGRTVSEARVDTA